MAALHADHRWVRWVHGETVAPQATRPGESAARAVRRW